MQYILGAKDKSRCVFCDACACKQDEMRERLVLVATDHAAVVLNRYPFNAGHLLVIPTKHVSSLDELDATEFSALWDLTKETNRRLKKAVGAQGINLGMNLGEVAGAGIAEHIHVHLVPRWSGDTNFMPVIGDVRVMPQHLDATFNHLYPHFTDIEGRRA